MEDWALVRWKFTRLGLHDWQDNGLKVRTWEFRCGIYRTKCSVVEHLGVRIYPQPYPQDALAIRRLSGTSADPGLQNFERLCSAEARKSCRWNTKMAERTGLEPATPGVTGRYSNQLNYRSGIWWVLTGSNRRPSPCKGDALPAELSTRVDAVQMAEKPVITGFSGLLAPAGRASLRHPSGLCQP